MIGNLQLFYFDINKIDQDLKRKITDIKNKIKSVKKWATSNKTSVDLKLISNSKSISDMEIKISELSDRLNSRCKAIEL
jgi:phenylalanyl-tRNA synthetase alpha subunit